MIIAWEICSEFSDHGPDILFADLHEAYSNVSEASCLIYFYENHNIAFAMSSSSRADTDSVLTGGRPLNV